MAVTIKLRRGLSTDWSAANPVLAQGEVGVELDTLRAKIGDGVTVWDALPWFIETGVDISGHVNDTSIHFTQAQIVHQNIGGAGALTHGQLDAHVVDSTVHFTQGSINHNNIQNKGNTSHADIDTHIGDATKHFAQSAIDHNAIQNRGSRNHGEIDSHMSGWQFNHGQIDAHFFGAQKTHTQIDAHLNDAGIHDPVVAQRQNHLMNSEFDIAQRGYNLTASSGIAADRWRFFNAVSISHPQDPGQIHGSRRSCQIVAAAGVGAILLQNIELAGSGYPGEFTQGTVVTVSGYVKSSVAGNGGVVLNWAEGATGNQIATGSVPLAFTTSWAYFEKQITITTVPGANSDNLQMQIFGVTGAVMSLARLKLEVSQKATPYYRESRQENYARIQRYYFVMDCRAYGGDGGQSAGTNRVGYIGFPVLMRVAPVSVLSAVGGTVFDRQLGKAGMGWQGTASAASTLFYIDSGASFDAEFA